MLLQTASAIPSARFLSSVASRKKEEIIAVIESSFLEREILRGTY
jgi:hypothetical protein